jgi:hypothetical protein
MIPHILFALWALPLLVVNAVCACMGPRAPLTCRATTSNAMSIAWYAVRSTRLPPPPPHPTHLHTTLYVHIQWHHAQSRHCLELGRAVGVQPWHRSTRVGKPPQPQTRLGGSGSQNSSSLSWPIRRGCRPASPCPPTRWHAHAPGRAYRERRRGRPAGPCSACRALTPMRFCSASHALPPI